LASSSPRLLVVANANETTDVLAALADAGMDRPIVGTGGDETLELYESTEPDVVVMVAGLLEGDVTSLAGAMRSGSYGRAAPIVLVEAVKTAGNGADEIRSVDFEHFIERPLQSKVLVDAVLTSSRNATGARLEAAMAMAIEDFVSDAMGSLSFSDMTVAEPGAAPAEPDEAAVEKPVDEGDVLSAEEAGADVIAEASALLLGEQTTAQAELTRPLQPTMPASNWREATQVLGEGGGDSRPGLDQESAQLLDELLPGETDSGEDEQVGEAENEAVASTVAESEDSGPRGGDFARQLREKMSAMAERLFPGQQAEDNAINMAAPSTEHTEIDLGSIVDEDDEEGYDASTQAMVSESEITMSRGSDSGATTGEIYENSTTSRGGQPLVGVLDAHENDIATVLARFWNCDFSGSLVLRRDNEEKQVQFDKGSVVFASSGAEDDRMSALLLREGRINKAQLEECRFQVEASGRRMGEVLVDKGYLKPRELLPAVRQHLEDIFYSLFAWEEGTFDALPEQALDERIRLSRHPAALIVEGIRRKYGTERVEACLGGVDTVVVVDNSKRMVNIVGATELSVNELQAQRLFDGSHSLKSIAAECEVDVLRVAQLAHAFVCLDVAEVVETRTDEGPERGSVAGTHLVGETDLEIDRQRVLAKYQLVQAADYFQLLGVRLDASAFEIRRAYEASVHRFAMDSFPPPLQEELREVIIEISELIEEAFLVLSNDAFRSSYRANLQ
jgi:hypothetical protein